MAHSLERRLHVLLIAVACVLLAGLPRQAVAAVAADHFLPAMSEDAPVAGADATPPETKLPAGFVALSLGLLTATALDVDSTRRALDAGGHEANPMMIGVVGSPFKFVAVKGGAAAAAIWATSRLRKTHPKAAAAVLAVANVGLGLVATHNYMVAAQAGH
jgi:uncharacterized membrane protein